MVFNKLRKAFSDSVSEGIDDEYVEIDLGKEEKENKVLVKLFVIKKYDDVNSVLTALRDGFTITILDIQTLRKKDPIELKRAISKVKKTCDALEGTIAGFGENMVIVTPSFAKIEKEPEKVEKTHNKFETY